jgi:hypothetical protein
LDLIEQFVSHSNMVSKLDVLS